MGGKVGRSPQQSLGRLSWHLRVEQMEAWLALWESDLGCPTRDAGVRGSLQLRTTVGVWSSRGKGWIVVPVGSSEVELLGGVPAIRRNEFKGQFLL